MFDHGKIGDMKRVRNDCILILIVVLLAGGFWFVQYINSMQAEAVLRIYQNGELRGEYDLSQPKTLPVKEEDYGYNLVMIEDGTVRITDADCPDQLCMKQRSISKNGESIICLPHKLVVSLTGYSAPDGQDDLDVIIQ